MILSNCHAEQQLQKGPTAKLRQVRQTLFDLNATACGKLCDSAKIDSITPMNLEKDANNNVLIVRGLCTWNLDLKNPSAVSQYGNRHRFKYDKVEAIFTIFDHTNQSNKYNMTALFTSGMTGQTFRTEGNNITKVWFGAIPLPGYSDFSSLALSF